LVSTTRVVNLLSLERPRAPRAIRRAVPTIDGKIDR